MKPAHLLFTAAFGCLLSTTAFAFPPGGPGGPRGGPGHASPPHELIRAHADELGLDAATVDEIVQIAEDSHDEIRETHEAIRMEKDKLHELLRAETPNRQRVMAQVDAVSRAEAAMKKQQLGILMDIRALLTPEQRAALNRIQPKRGPMNADHPGRPPRHHGPPPPPPPGGEEPLPDFPPFD